MEENGEIFDLTRQKKYELVPKHKRADGSTERACYYIADFVYWELGAGEPELTVEDVKGMKTPLYNLKRKLMLDRYGITIHEVR